MRLTLLEDRLKVPGKHYQGFKKTAYHSNAAFSFKKKKYKPKLSHE